MNQSSENNIQKKTAGKILLDAIFGTGCYNAEILRNSESECERARQEELCMKLQEAVDSLSPTEKSVIIARFGLEGEKKSYSELAKLKGISEERIREIEVMALRKMRHPSRARPLRDLAKSVAEDVKESEADSVKDEDSIENLELSVRTYMCLTRAGITTLTKLKDTTVGELICTRGMGGRSISEIIIKMMEYETV